MTVMNLKPCPFCRSKDIRVERIYDYYEVICSDCLSCTEEYATKDEAIEVWNNRTSPWHTGTPIEEGRYLIENIDGYNEILEWYNGHWYEEDPNSVDCRCKVSDSWVIAWQKIEPYKGKERK